MLGPVVLLASSVLLLVSAYKEPTRHTTVPTQYTYSGIQGPLAWHTLDPKNNFLCAHGHRQSPINIRDGIYDKILNTDGTRPVLLYPTLPSPTFRHVGRTVQVAANGSLTLPQNGGSTEWDLAQFHFHTPAEHRLWDEHYPLEIHFVHKLKNDSSKLLVLGIVFDLSTCNCTPPIFQTLMSLVSQIPKTNDSVVTPALNFQPVIDHVRSSDIYQYGGSLTTPPCSEGVTWLVVGQPIPLDVKSYNEAKKVLKFNARYTQNDPGSENLLVVAAEGL